MHIPVLQVNEVLQVELSGVLSEIDGVHILEEVKMTTGEEAGREAGRGNSFMTVRSGTSSTAAEKTKTKATETQHGR